ncbi:hypothetical protein CFOL_v3_02899 [Cephalotus follicularis]|uniref:Uncharacterized protein n=1 Tax=Cephalotus follicularis TaxID=3775 RepID=A0A1Q3AUF7_CEPFO|nr:hypothetical protein CFOL_v3_02899 [Cephalotus follicularis]
MPTDISGITCKHVCCLGHTRENPGNYYHEYFSVGRLFETYSDVLHPIAKANIEPSCLNENIQPPPLKRLQGRPIMTRRRELGEPVSGIKRSSTVKCITCGFVHNKRRCQRGQC